MSKKKKNNNNKNYLNIILSVILVVQVLTIMVVAVDNSNRTGESFNDYCRSLGFHQSGPDLERPPDNYIIGRDGE